MNDGSTILDDIQDFLKDLMDEKNFVLVNLMKKGSFIELVMDRKDGGITLDELSDINRTVTEWIDQNKLITGKYMLDVCSPGLDRLISSDSEYEWALGKKIVVFCKEPVGDKFEHTGIMVSFDRGTGIFLDTGATEKIFVDMDNIKKAKMAI